MASGLQKRLLSNSGWLFGAEGISLALKLVSGFALARALGLSQFGHLALITAFVMLVGQLLDFRAWETATRFVIKYRTARENVKAGATVKLCYLLDFGAASVACLLVIAGAGLAARLFVDDPAAAPSIRVFALIVIVSAPIATSSALLRVANMFRAIAVKTSLIAAVRATVLIGAAWSGASVHEILMLQVAVAALDGVVSVLLARVALRELDLSTWRASPLVSLRDDRRALRTFLLSTNLAALLKVLQAQLDVLLVGYFLPTESAGYYQLARSITDAMRFLAVPVHVAAYPEYTRLWEQRGADDARRLTRSLLLITSGLAAVGCVLVIVLADPTVRYLAGVDYLPAVPVVVLLAIGTALEVPAALFHPLLLAAERMWWSMASLTAAVGTRIILLVALVPAIGPRGAGFAHIGYIVVYVICAGLASRRALHELSARGSA